MKRTLLVLPFLAACGAGGGGSGDFGATPGGVKDMSLARDLIANGQIPPPEALLVEAMFAEHELGLEGPTCDDRLCLLAAAGVAPDRAGLPHGWLQVAMSSNIDPDTWQRPATTFIFTVDVSGSMGWEYADGESPAPSHLAKLLLHQLTDQVGPADEIAIVTYGSDVDTRLGITSGDDKPAIRAVIDSLSENGSTNMEAGLRRAYEIGADAIERGRPNVRVILFSDEQPNVGATTPSQFEGIVADGADQGVGITVLALGLGIGAEVLEGMSHLRGANAFSFTQNDHTTQFITDDWPWFTTPFAYDLTMAVAPSPGLAIDQAYGFPGTFADDPQLVVSTIFLSKRKGALLVSLAPTDAAALDTLAADLDLTFETPGGDLHTQALSVARDGAPLDERGHWAGQPMVAVTTGLALLVDGMHDAAVEYASNPELAQQTMQVARDRFVADAEASGDPQLAVEIELADAMLQLIVERAPQGTLYGSGS